MTQLDNLQLLLSHADDQANAPVLQNGLPATAVRVDRAAQPDQERTPRRSASEQPDDLAMQRWGLVVPEGELGIRLLDCIAPLIKRRQEEQEGNAPIVFRVPGHKPMNADEANRWRDNVYDELSGLPGDRIREEDQPAYLLILGDLHEVPEAIHQVLSSDCYVGRLAISTLQGEPDFQRYECYVEKLLRWERRAAPVSLTRTRFGAVDDQTAATDLGRRALIEPALAIAQQDLSLGKLPALDAQSLQALMLSDPNELLAAAESPDPTVLFTISHGAGSPRGGFSQAEMQRAIQGAMCFGQRGKLTGDDLLQRTFLPGGVWFMLACYGAGTPSESLFRHWLDQLRSAGHFSGGIAAVLAGLPKAGDRPFIAALPQSVLGNPQGPLAFIGHLDLAWTYSFQEIGRNTSRSRPGRFLNLVKSLLRRHRVGVALHELTRYVSNINLEITTLIDRATAAGVQPDPAQLGHLWMLRQDLLGYVLLGDPAVRLPY